MQAVKRRQEKKQMLNEIENDLNHFVMDADFSTPGVMGIKRDV